MEFNIPLLEPSDIEVRIQQACKGNKALALLYKTSRTDMRILDESVGANNWKDDYREIKGNLYCGISIYDADKKEWVTKWDCGIESGQEDGNEKKAEASDSFKRAGTKWGIGRELYTSPQIFINAETEANGTRFKLKNPYAKYYVSFINYDDKRKIVALEIVDSKNNVVYTFGSKNKPTKANNVGTNKKSSQEEKPVVEQANKSQEYDNPYDYAENYVVPAGKYEGKVLGEVPSEYLQWIVEKAKSEELKKCARLVLEMRNSEE